MPLHDWSDLSLDYEAATVLNDIDNQKELARLRAMGLVSDK